MHKNYKLIAVVIYEVSERQGKYPPLFTNTEMKNCFNKYQASE